MSTSTLRERILTSIAALLNPIPDCVVYRSREAALARAEGPAILIRPEEEQVQSTAQFVVWRHFRVGISVIARDDIPDQTADPIILAIQTAMLAGLPYPKLRDAVIAHLTTAEGLGLLLGNVPDRTPANTFASIA